MPSLDSSPVSSPILSLVYFQIVFTCSLLDHDYFVYLYPVVPLSACEVLPCHLSVKSKPCSLLQCFLVMTVLMFLFSNYGLSLCDVHLGSDTCCGL